MRGSGHSRPVSLHPQPFTVDDAGIREQLLWRLSGGVPAYGRNTNRYLDPKRQAAEVREAIAQGMYPDPEVMSPSLLSIPAIPSGSDTRVALRKVDVYGAHWRNGSYGKDDVREILGMYGGLLLPPDSLVTIPELTAEQLPPPVVFFDRRVTLDGLLMSCGMAVFNSFQGKLPPTYPTQRIGVLVNAAVAHGIDVIRC